MEAKSLHTHPHLFWKDNEKHFSGLKIMDHTYTMTQDPSTEKRTTPGGRLPKIPSAGFPRIRIVLRRNASTKKKEPV